MKRYFFNYLLLLLCQCLNAQSDSMTVVKTKWEKQKVAKGIWRYHAWFDHTLFGSRQNINILEVKLNSKNEIDVGAEPQALSPTSEFGRRAQALAAINGTFYDMKNGGSVDYVRINGTVLHENKLPQNKARYFHQHAAIVTDHNKVRIVPWDGSADWEASLAGDDVMVTGPLLLFNQQRASLDTTAFYRARHPRTALALKGNKLLLITVDGRNEKAAGMSLPELTSLLKWLQTEHAINLDGGGSTTMWISCFPDGGVVNHPSDNNKTKQTIANAKGTDPDSRAADTQRWDHGKERPVANVLLVSSKRKHRCK